jgi:hypothetical protein
MSERPPLNEEREPLPEEEKEVAFVAWALKARDKAFVPTDEFLPAAKSMEGKGWLSSTTLENGRRRLRVHRRARRRWTCPSWSASAAPR